MPRENVLIQEPGSKNQAEVPADEQLAQILFQSGATAEQVQALLDGKSIQLRVGEEEIDSSET